MKQWYYKHFNDVKDLCEFLNKHKFNSEDFKFGKSGIETSYTILYYSDKELW